MLRTCNTCQLIVPQRFVHTDWENEITINCIPSPFKVDFKLNDGKQSRTMFRYHVRFHLVWMRSNVGRSIFRRPVGAAVSLTLINPRWRIYDVTSTEPINLRLMTTHRLHGDSLIYQQRSRTVTRSDWLQSLHDYCHAEGSKVTHRNEKWWYCNFIQKYKNRTHCQLLQKCQIM